MIILVCMHEFFFVINFISLFRFNTAVYGRLRFQEIARRLEAALAGPCVLAAPTQSQKYVVFNGEKCVR